MQMGYQFAAPRIINQLENMVIEIVINTAVCIEQPFNLSDCSDVDDDSSYLDYNVIYETSTNLQRLLEKLYVSTAL